jgi:hypothetical protein
MNITNPFSKVDPFNKYTIINSKSLNRLISKDVYPQSDIELKFMKLIKNKNKDFLLNIQSLLEQALLKIQVNT